MPLVVLAVAALWVSSTVAVAPCSDVIISGLSHYSECYDNGQPPALLASGGVGTHVVISRGELPADTGCVTASQDSQHAYVTLYLTSGSNISVTYDHTVKGSHIEETDQNGVKYRLYVIHNYNNVYSYYRCIQGSSGGSGSHMVDVAVGCKYVTNADSLAAIERAKSCFDKLGVTNYVTLQPCSC